MYLRLMGFMYIMCLVAQSWLTLCNPMDCNPPGSSCPWGFSRQEYWDGLLCPPAGHLPSPGIKPRSPALQADSLPSETPEKPMYIYPNLKIISAD